MDWENRLQDHSEYSFGSDLAVRDEKHKEPQQTTSNSNIDESITRSTTVSFRFRSLEAERILADELSTRSNPNTQQTLLGNPRETSVTRELSFADGISGASISRSRLSGVTVYESTLPMAFDNDRFFDCDFGYQDSLTAALSKIEAQASARESWRAANTEVSFLGRIWRSIFRLLLSWTCDTINRLRLTRGLTDHLNFLTAYESFILGGFVRAHDGTDPHSDTLDWELVLQNRNVSRIVLQAVGSRWDWFFHTHTQLQHRRLFDLLGWLPWIGRYADPPSENYPSSRWYSLWNLWDSFLELFRWHNDDAHNLTPETTGFEQAVCDHFGTHFGRIEFNKFRTEHRVTIDESIVRSFVSNPSLTLRNNGVEHVLRCVSKHWREMLTCEHGNFAHQRMELLNPFEALRYHLPATLHVLANLRGRNVWDSRVLAPLVRQLQHVDPSRTLGTNNTDEEVQSENQFIGPCQAGRQLAQKIKHDVVTNVCAGIPSRMEPLHEWIDAIIDSFSELQSEAQAVSEFVATVQTGTQLGYQLLKTIDWTVPRESVLRLAVQQRILRQGQEHPDIPFFTIDRALEKLSPKDERTLRECVKSRLTSIQIAKLLLQQSVRLLEREVRRHRMDECIRNNSMGPFVDPDNLERSRWYWVNDGNGYCVCLLSRTFGRRLKFIRIDSGDPVLHDKNYIRCRNYIPLAEAITRAQKAYMTIEVDHCKRFSYDAFLEFGLQTSSPLTTSLRSQLRRLIVVSQISCRELDDARLNALAEIRTSVAKRRKTFGTPCLPQNVAIIGGLVVGSVFFL